MTFWQENYPFIKDVYLMRQTKMVEWMENVEKAISRIMADKVYTSAEFKRERDNFHVRFFLSLALCFSVNQGKIDLGLVTKIESPMGLYLYSVLNSMYRLGPVNMLVTHTNTEGFGLTPLSVDRCGYMSPLLKTKQ
jgi:hypothetical protein